MVEHIHHDIPKLKRDTAPDGTRVYRTPSGNAYPSVTTVTGMLGKASIMAWRKRVGDEEANRVSARAAKRGTRIHSLCEDFLNNKFVEPDFFEYEMWNTLVPVLSEIDKVHALETPLYSDHLEVAGTVDCIAEFRGKLSIIDFKTSKRIKSRDDIHNYFMQCAAYAVAFEERTGISVPRLVIIMAVDDEDPLIFVEKRDEWIGKFIEVRQQYRIMNGV